MYDVIRNRYRLRCPVQDVDTWIAVSDFRTVRRLRGASKPAVFRVEYDCGCGRRHESLVTHDRLDYEPLGTEATGTFANLLTGTRELVGLEMADIAMGHLKQGSWPWTFWCHPESAPRPGFPSSLRMVAPAHAEGHHTDGTPVGVLVRCFSCARMTVNLVSREHLDVPFHNDPVIHFVDRTLADDRLSVEEAFRHQLFSGRYRSEELGEAS